MVVYKRMVKKIGITLIQIGQK